MLSQKRLYFTAGLILLSIFFFPAADFYEKKFSVILLPDTQDMTARDTAAFASQIDWIKINTLTLKIAHVIHLGDVTDGNTHEEWRAASDILSRLDGTVTYSIAAGNHDLDHRYPREPELFNKYFPVSRFEKQEGWGGTCHPYRMENSYKFFSAGGIRYIVLTLEFGPRAVIVNWADSILKKYKKIPAIINTHCFVYDDNTRVGKRDQWNPHGYSWIDGSTGGSRDNANDGDELWDFLIYDNPNVFLVVSGHIKGRGAGRLVSLNKAGLPVFQLLANYQRGISGSENGTSAYLRILFFNPAEQTIMVKTWSPKLKSFKTSSDHEFGMDLKTGTFF